MNTFTYRLSLFQLFRPLTLTGTISTTLAGTTYAAAQGPIRADVFIVFLIAAILVQATANMLNDYYDFRNGQDKEKWIAAGEPGYGQGPAYTLIPRLASVMLLIAVILGVWLALQSNIWVAVTGAVGILLGYLYSAGPRPLSSLGLGELVAAVFLGIVPVSLAYIVQGHALDVGVIALSVPFSLLIASMVLTNNIRDINKDKAFRKTLPILLGRKKAVLLLSVLLLFSYLWLLLLAILHIIPWLALLAFLALPAALQLCRLLRSGAPREDERKAMKWSAQHHWLFGILCFIGMLFAQL